MDTLNGWIDIVEFAIKYGVSQSSLRRRIKAKSIEYKMHKGKYLLPDTQATIQAAPLFTRFNLKVASESDQRLADILTENKRLRERVAELEMLVGVMDSNAKTA